MVCGCLLLGSIAASTAVHPYKNGSCPPYCLCRLAQHPAANFGVQAALAALRKPQQVRRTLLGQAGRCTASGHALRATQLFPGMCCTTGW